MKRVEISNKKTAFASLSDFCNFSMGNRKDKDDFIEVTQWINGEGYDVTISDIGGTRSFDLTHGQFIALKKCIKKFNYESRI